LEKEFAALKKGERLQKNPSPLKGEDRGEGLLGDETVVAIPRIRSNVQGSMFNVPLPHLEL